MTCPHDSAIQAVSMVTFQKVVSGEKILKLIGRFEIFLDVLIFFFN
jgi:hypothetical protein